jgi:hypothetical protein
MRSLRLRSANDLPCHGMAPVLIFYSRLSPRQPRATLKTKINGGLRGPPFVEARVRQESPKERIGFYEALDSSARQPRKWVRRSIAQLVLPLQGPRPATGNLPKSFDYGPLIDEKPAMAKKPGTNPKGEFAFFNVFYEDGSQRSNRRVPAELLGGLDGDEPARAYIMEQDREIAEKSGRPALEIKNLERVGAKKK